MYMAVNELLFLIHRTRRYSQQVSPNRYDRAILLSAR